ncbi:MAG: OsmC family protein [Bacteroidetes bacterium]|nr:OsmC family protein [Bacteroidota bacterium]
MSIEVYFAGKKKVNAMIDGYTVCTDQPVEAGGEASAPTPFATFLASLGACAGIYVKGFCEQRGINTEAMTIDMDYVYDPSQKMIAKFIMKIFVSADFPAQYEEAVIRAASLCAVKRHLHPSIENEITIVRR